MTQDSLDEIPEPTPETAASETTEPIAPAAAATELPALTAERVVDITLGLVSVAAEAANGAIQRLGENAKTLQENAPAIREALEERGRPIREQLVTRLRETLPTKSTASDTSQEPGVAVTLGPSSTVSAASSATSPAADQEISALEQRVRELEQQVSAPIMDVPIVDVPIVETPVITPPFVETPIVETPALPAADIAEEETTAEWATFVPEEEAPTALADSEYAVSETEEEVEHEEDTKAHEEKGEAH